MNASRQPSFRPEKRCCSDGSVLHASSVRGVAIAGFLLLGSFLIGCDRQDTSQLFQEREEAVADTIRSLATVGPYPDPEPYLRLYSEDAPFYSEGLRLSRSEHEAAVHEHVSDPADVKVQASEPEVEVLGPRAAVASILLRGHVTDTAGERRKVSGAITQVYELQDGEWKVVQAHESFAPEKSF